MITEAKLFIDRSDKSMLKVYNKHISIEMRKDRSWDVLVIFYGLYSEALKQDFVGEFLAASGA